MVAIGSLVRGGKSMILKGYVARHSSRTQMLSIGNVDGQYRSLHGTGHQNFRRSKSVLASAIPDAADAAAGPSGNTTVHHSIPQRIRDKIVSAEDAVALVRDHDTVCVSGFVCQGAPEALLKALGERFLQTQEPKDLTLLFGGGPGDYGDRGLSHLAKVSEDGKNQMLRRTIGGAFQFAEYVLSQFLFFERSFRI